MYVRKEGMAADSSCDLRKFKRATDIGNTPAALFFSARFRAPSLTLKRTSKLHLQTSHKAPPLPVSLLYLFDLMCLLAPFT